MTNVTVRLPRRLKQWKTCWRGFIILRAFLVLQAAFWNNDDSTPTKAEAFVGEPTHTKTKNAPHRPRCGITSVTRRTHHHRRFDARLPIALAGQNINFDGVTTEAAGMCMDFQNMNILNDLVVASSLSYLSSAVDDSGDGSTLSSSSKMEVSPYLSKKNLKPLVQVVDPKTESGATVFKYTSNGGDDTTIVVACRGSATPINFLTNLRFKLVPFKDEQPDSEFLVHEGFQDATEGLWELLGPELEVLESRGDYNRVVFTGHSLGAANALLCATKYQSGRTKGDQSVIPLEGVVTFGGPRLVNTALAHHFDNGLLDSKSVVVRNYIHDKDPILRQNGPLWDSLGFGIVGSEVQCEPYEPVAYHSEQEKQEKAGAKLPLAWNILDHCNYLGIFVGPRLV